MKKIRRTISSLTLRAFCRDTSNSGMRVRKEGWFFQKRQESTLTQSDPSIDDGFNIAAFYVEGQLDFPNQVPENVLQLYHELYDMEQKVKELENEIAVYVMSFQNKSRPAPKRGAPPRIRKTTNFQRKCCIPGLWNCARPVPVISETYQRNRAMSRTVPVRSPRNSISTAVQTTNLDGGSRLSKVSWNSEVDVRYIGSGIFSEKAQNLPLQAAELQQKANEELKNVVHLKIKIPKDVLNLTNDDGGQVTKRLDNEWKQFNSLEENMNEDKNPATTQRPKADSWLANPESVPPRQSLTSDNQHRTRTSSINRNQTEPSRQLKSDLDASNIGQTKLEAIREKESTARGNTIVGTSIVHDGKDRTQMVGIPVKPPGKPVCDSEGCSCTGSTQNDKNLERVRQSFDMTESELSILEEAVHNTAPMELKIRTEYGSVNVISHEPDCKCEICETFGSHNEARHKRSGRSDSAAVISKKIIRVYYNGDYRNIITHTEECGCDICSNIEEHSYKLMSQRGSIVSTHRGELIVKNKGVCGCKNCKTVEMGPHVVDVETMLSRTSSHAFDKCYYSDATIPSMQSFPREGITTTDDQGASFSSPPSINSSDLSDDLYGQSPSASNVDTRDDRVVNAHTRPGQNLKQFHNSHDAEIGETNKGKCSRCEDRGSLRESRNVRKRIYEFIKPSSAKSSPVGLNKHRKDNECHRCVSCKNTKGKGRQKKCDHITVKSKLSTHQTPSIPLERVPIIDDGKAVQPNNNKVSPNVDRKSDKKVSSYYTDHLTLEDIIRDLIRGQPGVEKDKIYTVTLGEISNKAYTKIHIVDCSSKSDEVRKNETATKGLASEPVRCPKGDASNSNVFFIKPLPSSTGAQAHSPDSLNVGDNQNNASSNNRSLSSPACIQDATQHHSLTQIQSPQGEGILLNTSERIQEIEMPRSASESSPRSDISRRAFKLTISFGKKVASFFKQRVKKRSVSDHAFLAAHEVPQGNPKCLKTFTIYEGEGKHLKQMELVQIDMKPRYFTLETSCGRNEANSPFTESPILCLVEKNSNTQVVATVAR